MVEKGIDIFSELESIQTTNISRAGKEQHFIVLAVPFANEFFGSIAQTGTHSLGQG